MTAHEIMRTWRDRLKASGQTQLDFAAQTGVNYVQLNRYLSGKTNPTIKIFDKIEKHLQELGV